ncbi:hypothetical protein [Marinicella sp. W31]|uniref:hypothetical protein n=1 Tax=Marinicella sp. W31 TaxID=3023713 RepID=UPI00375637B6
MLMFRKKCKQPTIRKHVIQAGIVLAMMGLLSAAVAQQGGVYEITKSTLNSSGGGKSSAGTYEVQGTIAQLDASEELSGGGFSVTGGFWPGSDDVIFKNGFDQ